jgi:hypothetical protein
MGELPTDPIYEIVVIFFWQFMRAINIVTDKKTMLFIHIWLLIHIYLSTAKESDTMDYILNMQSQFAQNVESFTSIPVPPPFSSVERPYKFGYLLDEIKLPTGLAYWPATPPSLTGGFNIYTRMPNLRGYEIQSIQMPNSFFNILGTAVENPTIYPEPTVPFGQPEDITYTGGSYEVRRRTNGILIETKTLTLPCGFYNISELVIIFQNFFNTFAAGYRLTFAYDDHMGVATITIPAVILPDIITQYYAVYTPAGLPDYGNILNTVFRFSILMTNGGQPLMVNTLGVSVTVRGGYRVDLSYPRNVYIFSDALSQGTKTTYLQSAGMRKYALSTAPNQVAADRVEYNNFEFMDTSNLIAIVPITGAHDDIMNVDLNLKHEYATIPPSPTLRYLDFTVYVDFYEQDNFDSHTFRTRKSCILLRPAYELMHWSMKIRFYQT